MLKCKVLYNAAIYILFRIRHFVSLSTPAFKSSFKTDLLPFKCQVCWSSVLREHLYISMHRWLSLFVFVFTHPQIQRSDGGGSLPAQSCSSALTPFQYELLSRSSFYTQKPAKLSKDYDHYLYIKKTNFYLLSHSPPVFPQLCRSSKD